MKTRSSFLSALLLAITPVSPLLAEQEASEVESPAQEDAELANLLNLFGSIFGEEVPLTPEAQERLPQAQAVVERLFPAGTYARLMDTTMSGMFDGLMELGKPSNTSEIARLTGLPESEVFRLDEAAIAEAINLLDPLHETRSQLVTEVLLSETTAMMEAIEPSYRAGLANAYAERFNEEQLAELLAFFDTPTGSYYASQSMLIYSDPQVMAKMNNIMPVMFERLPVMMTNVEQATAALPPERFFDTLEAVEQARVAELLGQDAAVLAENAVAIRQAQETQDLEAENWSNWFSSDEQADEEGLPSD